jgi:hypothetical protein
MANFDQFFVYKLHAALAWNFQKLDLGLYEQIEGQLGYKQAGPRSGGVTNCCTDIKNRKVHCWVDLFQRVTKYRVEDVVDPGTTAKLLGGDFSGCTVDR